MNTHKQFQKNIFRLTNGLMFIVLFLSATTQVFAQSYFSDQVEKLWETEPVFNVPESVYYYPEKDMVFVSNINGQPTDRDGNGFISQMETDGKIVRLEWVNGLHAPKGMGTYDGKLYVADIYRVAEIDINKRKILRFYEAKDAKFLNDVAIDEHGNVYITDTSTGAVYRISDGEISEWIPAGTFDSPNGLYYLDGKLYLGEAGHIVSIDPKTKKYTSEAEFQGSVDGLNIDKDGNFIFSDWSGKVQRMKPGGKATVLFNTTDDKINAADIFLMRKENILLVPTFFDNRVMAYQIKGR